MEDKSGAEPWLERKSSGDPGARRFRNEQNRAVSAYYEQFGGFAQDAHRRIQALNGRVPQREFTELVRDTAPSASYQVDRTCNAVLRAKKIVDEIQSEELPRTDDPGDTKPSNTAALLSRILEKKNIGQDTWLQGHYFKRSTFLDWKMASGKPVKGKVSVAKAREFEEAIRQDAMELGLMVTADI